MNDGERPGSTPGDDLDAEIDLMKQQLALTPPDSPDRKVMLSILGTVLSMRYAADGRREDLYAAIRFAEEAVALTPKDSPDRAAELNNLGNVLSMRYEVDGWRADLDAAIARIEESVALTPKDSPDRAARLNNLGNVLSMRYAADGRREDLDAAIRCAEEAMVLTPEDRSNRAAMLSSLGTAFSTRYAADGRRADLDDAIRLAEEAVALTPKDGPDRAGHLSNLGIAQSKRYVVDGRREDLDGAIRCAEEAVELTPKDSPKRAMYLTNLGNRFSTRYAANGRREDLDAAIRCAEEAVVLTPKDSSSRAIYLNNFGIKLYMRYAADGRREDLDAAIHCAEETVDLTPEGSPDRAMHLNNLGGHLRTRYERAGDPLDIDAAVACYQAAIQLLGDGSPNALTIRRNLEAALRSRMTQSVRDPASVIGRAHADAQPFSTAHRGSESGFASLALGNEALERRDFETAAKLLEHALSARETVFAAVDAADDAAMRKAAGEHRLDWQRTYAGIGSRAAMALVKSGGRDAPVRAVLAMERGLQQGYLDVFDLISVDLERFSEAGFRGAERFRNARRRLALLTAQTEAGGIGAPSAAALEAARREFDSALADIRSREGFADFLAPVDAATVRRAAAMAPLVYLGATSHGGMALIVPDNAAPVRVVDLPELATAAIGELSAWFAEARGAIDVQNLAPWRDAVDHMLRGLWHLGMGTLVEALEEAGVREAALIPYGGALAQLPWHAAWTPDAARPGGRRYACDDITWRYAPNAKLAVAARDATAGARHADEAVAIWNKEGLDGSIHANAMKSAFAKVQENTHATPTRQRVIAACKRARHAVLVFHGKADPAAPLETRLLLGKSETLRIADLLAEPTPLASEVITLAACEAAVTSGAEFDEIVSFPAALLRAGAAQVLAPLWPVFERPTQDLLAAFYGALGAAQDGNAAAALAQATASLRSAPVPAAQRPQPRRPLFGRFFARPRAEPMPVPAHAGARMGLANSNAGGADSAARADGETSAYDWSHPIHWAAFTLHGLPARPAR